MKIWFVEIGEPLPIAGQHRPLRYGMLTKFLAKRGHQVTWWACDFVHQTKSFVGPPNSTTSGEGVEIVLVHGSGYSSNIGLARLIHIKVHARSLQKLMGKHDRPDLIVAAMPTADACAVAIEYGRKHKVPVLIDIRDEWPSDFFRVLPKTVQGVSKALLASAFRKLAVVCRAADGLLAVSERQLAYGLKAAGRTRQSIDRVFHTGAPKNPPIPLADSERRTLLSSFGVYEPSLVCLYAGTLSKSRPLGPVIDAVRGLPSTCQVTLLIAGQGDLRSAYEAMGKGCSSIRFLGWQNEADLAQLLELADVFVAPYHPDFGFSLPTKMFDYFQIGRPIISSCPGEAEQLITAFNLGFSYRFDDVEAIKLALLTLASDPDLRVKMGERAQRLFRERFEISVIQEEFARHLEALAVGDH